jgi:hypothetical protein
MFGLAAMSKGAEARLRPDVSLCGSFETLLQKIFDFLFRGRFLHDSLVHVGYFAFAVDQGG